MITGQGRKLLGRVTLAFLSTSLVLLGILALRRGFLLHGNYWGGLVFVPAVLVVGLLGLYIAMFRWHVFTRPRERLTGKAARKAEQAASYRAPIDDYDKPWRGRG